MNKIFKIDLGELSTRDWIRFIDFYRRHKNLHPKEIVDTWNKYAGKLSRHVFISEEGQVAQR